MSVYVPTLEECAEIARRMTREALIEQEQAAGQAFGPMHRQWQLERAPERIHRLIERSRQVPGLIGGSGDFSSPLFQFPPVSLRAAINNTVTETNLWDPGIFCFVPANSMRTGMRWEVTFGGVMGTTSTPTISWTSRFGTNNSAPPTGTTMGAGPTVTLGTFSAQPFFGKFYLGCRLIDVAATLADIAGTGFVCMPAAAAATVTPHAVMGGVLPTTIDQTVNQGIGVSIIWGTANGSNTLTPQYVDCIVSG